MKIGIDIDDCLATYTPVFLQRVHQYYGIKVPITAMNGSSAKTEDYGFISKEQARQLLILDRQDQVLINLSTYPDCVTAVNNLAKNHQVHLITSRDNYEQKLLKAHTKDWLKKHGFIYHNLEFSQDKGEYSKKLGLELFIDDSLKFAKQATSCGIPVILFAQPWNQNYQQYLGKDLSFMILGRCDSWERIIELINKLELREAQA